MFFLLLFPSTDCKHIQEILSIKLYSPESSFLLRVHIREKLFYVNGKRTEQINKCFSSCKHKQGEQVQFSTG